MLPFTVIDCALLLAEWVMGGRWSACPVCEGPQPGGGHEKRLSPVHATYKGGHQSDCAMDLALAERGFPTQESRDAARDRIRAAHRATDAPPPPASTVPPEAPEVIGTIAGVPFKVDPTLGPGHRLLFEEEDPPFEDPPSLVVLKVGHPCPNCGWLVEDPPEAHTCTDRPAQAPPR